MGTWHRTTAGLTTAALLVTGCATSTMDRVRKDWTIPPERSDHDVTLDYTKCTEQAQKDARGLMIAGSALIGVAVLVWPLIPIGAVVAGVGGVKSGNALKRCVLEAGYDEKSPAAPNAAAAPASEGRAVDDVAERPKD